MDHFNYFQRSIANLDLVLIKIRRQVVRVDNIMQSLNITKC